MENTDINISDIENIDIDKLLRNAIKEDILGNKYSKSTVSRITDLTIDRDANKIIERHCNKISKESKAEEIGIDNYSKKFNLSPHLSILATGIIKKNDLTDIAYKNGISKSQRSKLNNVRPLNIFEKVIIRKCCTRYKIGYVWYVFHPYLGVLTFLIDIF